MDAQELGRRYKAGERGFSNVNLRGASLWAAYLSEADLSGAELADGQLAQAKALKGAILPDGIKYK